MEVSARAPGKIILTGEHAVVHGSTAVASSIDLYTYVSLHFSTPSGILHFLSLVNFIFNIHLGIADICYYCYSLAEIVMIGNGVFERRRLRYG